MIILGSSLINAGAIEDEPAYIGAVIVHVSTAYKTAKSC